MSKKKKVLITGATGQVGGALIPYLLIWSELSIPIIPLRCWG